MLSTVVPALAAEQPTPQFSTWATADLAEGEKYGIFPMEWYFDSFQEEISKERLDALLTQTEAKIAAIGLEKNASFTPVDVDSTTLRGNVINELFNIIAQYDLPVGDSAVAYMQERSILKGSSKGLGLDRVATTEEAVLFATRLIQDTYAIAEAGSKGVAWKVEKNGNLVYLLGSIHVGTPELYPFSQKLLGAFNEADALLVEANLFDQEGMQYFANASMLEEGKTIKDVVSSETYEKVLLVFEKYGLPADALAQMKPWSLASYFSNLSLGEAIGMPAEQLASLGIDMYFLTNALLTQKPIVELEGMKAQSDMFNGLSAEAQEQYLAETLDSILTPAEEGQDEGALIKEWLGYWNEGDKDAFAESFNSTDAGSSEFETMLLGERDKNMAAKIAELLESDEKGTYFLVVGAGHFVGPETILFHLKNKGYEIEEFYQ